MPSHVGMRVNYINLLDPLRSWRELERRFDLDLDRILSAFFALSFFMSSLVFFLSGEQQLWWNRLCADKKKVISWIEGATKVFQRTVRCSPGWDVQKQKLYSFGEFTFIYDTPAEKRKIGILVSPLGCIDYYQPVHLSGLGLLDLDLTTGDFFLFPVSLLSDMLILLDPPDRTIWT